MISSSKIDELLDRWEESLAQGQALTPDELCADCPDLKEPLSLQIAALQKVREKFDSLSKSQIPQAGYDIISEPTNVPAARNAEGSVSVMTGVDQLSLFATGGLGKIYCGNDTVLHREVAVKFLQEQHVHRPRMLERFVAEAEITSRLDHPNIVPVHGFGWTAAGHPFYVMRLIRGETLDAEIDRFHAKQIRTALPFRSSEFRDLLQRLKDTCNAIAYAHSRGIVHLDIKPQNILIGKYGETLVVDWGLAATVGREARFRMNGEQTMNLMMTPSANSSSYQGGGTPAYMSPEQVVWQPPPGPASDLFCLGATLFKICTGRPPYRGNRQPKPIDANLAVDYPLPREIVRQIPKPLQSICLKAMAMQPEKRYETAQDLAADLDRYLAGAKVHAHTEGPGERVSRFVLQHRRSSGTAAALIGLLLIASVVSSVRYAEIARREADARQTMEQLQLQTLAGSARYAAEMFAGEIQNRWTVLDKAASSPLLKAQVQKFVSGDVKEFDKTEMQNWLGEQYMHYRDLNAASWFIVAADGTQLVVFPRNRTISEGGNYRFRDYFHGLGKHFEKDNGPESLKPLRTPHLSVPYVSTNSSRLRVALSVPIWKDEEGVGEPIGVLGLSTELGQMKMLENAILIDIRPDQFEGAEQTGLVLQHPQLDQKNEPGQSVPRQFARVSPEILRQLTIPGERSILDADFVDPLNPSATAELAAAAPVIVNDWGANNQQRERSVGLIVVITQPKQNASKSKAKP